MEGADMHPVRDDGGGGPAKRRAMDPDLARHRAQVSRWSRDELEDKFLRIQEENLLLKKHCRKQEDKMKKMATKLLRLASDKRRAAGEPAVRSTKDVDLEEKLEEMQDRVRQLEREKAQLEEKFMVAKQHLQVAATSHKNAAYERVQSRINTGVPKKTKMIHQMRVAGPQSPGKSGKGATGTPKLPRYGHSLLEEAREQLQYMEEVVGQRDEQINMYEQEVDNLREEMKMKEHEFEEDILKIKQQTAGNARANLQENIDLIRLQREVKDKATKLTSVTTKYEELNQKMISMKEAHNGVIEEMEKLTGQLKVEQNKVLSLKSHSRRDPTHDAQRLELEERVGDFKKENEILKEANENLVSSAFDMERERDWRQRENALKVQIAQLEATLKADLGEKGTILDRLTAEREANEKKDKEHREMMREFYKVKEQYDELREKMKFFTKESAVDFNEIEEALVLVKQRKEKADEASLPFLEKVEAEKDKDLEKALRTLQADHAETIEELEKTRNMLMVQHQINRDYQAEVEAATKKLQEDRTEYELKLDEFAQLLDIRAARIRKLESQLRDVAYGTRQYRVRPDDEPVGSEVDETDETLHLERGQNLFEVHISTAHLSNEGLRHIGDEDPFVFCTWEFYEFETQATPIVKGANPEFDFTSQYIVKVDDFFLHYLQKDAVLLEVHQALGMDYQTIASCRLRFRDIFEKAQGRLHGSADLLGVDDRTIKFGSVEFWVRLKVPMDQALRLYKERTKALGYLSANDKTEEDGKPLDETAANRAPDNINELIVKIQRVNKVMSRRKDVQPSPYCMYKFHDFADHDTPIVPSTNSPEFNDMKSFPVAMATDVDQYLKTSALTVFVFDDLDPELTNYLGRATIPLMPLAHDKSIKGIFELKRADEKVNGNIEIFLKWQYSYLPPAAATMTPGQMTKLGLDGPPKRSRVPLMEGEQYTENGDIQPVPGTSELGDIAKSASQQRHMSLADDPSLLTSAVRRTGGTSSPLSVNREEGRRGERKSGPVPRRSMDLESDLEMTPTKLSLAKKASKTVDFNMTSPLELAESHEPLSQPSPPPPSAMKKRSSDPSVQHQGQPQQQQRQQEQLQQQQEPQLQQQVQQQQQQLSGSVAGSAQSARQSSPSQSQQEADISITSESPSDVSSAVMSSANETTDGGAVLSHADSHGMEVSQSVGSEVTVSQSEGGGDGGDESDSTVTITPDSTTELQDTKAGPTPKPRLSDEPANQKPPAKGPQQVTQGNFQGLQGTGTLRRKRRNREKQQQQQRGDEETDDEEERIMAAKAVLDKANVSDADKSFDTQFGDDEDHASNDEDDESIAEDMVETDGEASSVADSEGVVSPDTKRPLSAMSSDVVTIRVNHLSLEDDSKPMKDGSVTRLFVAYSFLDFPADELETPTSLPKPGSSHESITFNFQKVFHVDVENNTVQRQYLASMLLPESPDNGQLGFTVVSEPAEDDQNGDCADVGSASLSLPQVLISEKDFIDQDLEIFDVADESKVIGVLNVTVECLQALRAIRDEMIS